MDNYANVWVNLVKIMLKKSVLTEGIVHELIHILAQQDGLARKGAYHQAWWPEFNHHFQGAGEN